MIAILITLLLIASIVDIRTKRIPNWITLSGIFIAGLFNGVGAFSGFLLAGFLMWALAIALEHTINDFGIGGGDIKMAAMIGAFLGWPGALAMFMVTGLIAIIFLISDLTNEEVIHRNIQLPLAPFLSVAAIFHILGGLS